MTNYLKIRDESDNRYLRDEINCFEKPIGIVLDYYIKDASKFYFIYKKITQGDMSKKKVYIDEKQFITDILGLTCYDYSRKENFEDIIETAISKNQPVLISGDMFNLFSSDFYMEQHHGHLFLIVGYDAKKKLYTLLDDNPWVPYDGRRYFSQKIEYCTLEKVYKIDILQLIIVISNNNVDNFDYSSVLKYCIELYLSTDINAASEEEVINRINSNFNNENYNSEDDISTLINIPKCKRVVLNELVEVIEKYSTEFEKLYDLRDLATCMLDLTVRKINKVIRNIYKKELIDSKEYNSEICEFGIKIRNILTIFIDSFQLSNLNMKEDCLDKKYFIENNEDGIIQCKGDNEFIFSLGNKKIYNLWIEDCCPKVIYKYGNFNEDFLFVTSVDVHADFEEIGFLAGIVVKTENGNVFFWGINSGKNLILQHCCVNSCIEEIATVDYNAQLYVNIHENKCTFGYVDNSKFYSVCTIDLPDKVVELGVGCKTWINGEKLTVEFHIK